MPAPDARIAKDFAVVDVGSNSVRLVLYRLEGRAIWTVFNEKVLAGLGRGVETTGELSAEGVEEALRALRRFAAVVDGAAPAAVFTAATAAVREANDGREFVQRVAHETGLKLRILSGEEEARYSALGVLAGAQVNDGVVGDLGGSSLELVRIRDGAPEDGVSLPLGPFSLGAPRNFEASAVRAQAQERLREVGRRFTTRRFYAVGGAWRTLALIHMEIAHYPLKIAHHYEMTARDVIETARFVAKQSKGSLERIEGVSKKRVETLPWAAMVVEALVETLGFEKMWVSAYGIREGMLLEAMNAETRARDPLIEGCASLGARQGVAEGLGPALASWLGRAFAGLEPVFGGEREAVLIEAAARLADIGARLHPDHRADLAFAQVLRAPIAGQSHAERAFLAVAVHARYRGSVDTPDADVIGRLLNEDRFERARAVGLAMRLGCDLSGRTPSLLWQSRLEIDDERLLLTAESVRADMLLGEQTAKRANALADALGLTFESRVA
ncbi:MAG TPA: Ppx/GppA phosphatase family protein [Caulobacteraceae bacterium]|jgi:exopolyphosphatase/guanosine-5'-triphosphate,3'-diphosphate pyrophosphatase|nr:Ppx/GppA phosphatase family protein [Caulobacteraceae bacterium]